ncbi:MAG TPA: GNAT family N-acetyltransferase [Verrucomicrobiae bacterium]|jgi:RimJ/RimL family protein N-acetyltransferase|nr:GNAT family N-acetyltransferase [Verrucomicrobiae bacterium]
MSPVNDAEVTLRPVQDHDADDDDLLRRLYASTRAAELALLPWSQEQKDAFLEMQFAAQKRHYSAAYPSAHHDIICWKGKPVGRLYLARQADVFHILDVTVLPEERNSGIGSCVLRRILDEAQRAGRPATIYVESFNPSLRLFERFGFRQSGVEGFSYLLQSG